MFNRAAIIARPIGSLLAQSYRNIEVLIVDDRSSDDIAGAVAALGDDRVRLVHREKNGGAAAARNSGVAAARGEWIAFHDSDDVCSYDKIERQVRLLLSLPEDYIGVYTAVHYYMAVDEASYSKMISYIRPFPHMAPLSGDMFRQTLNENTFNLPTLLVKKHALVAAGPSDELMRNNVDWDLAIRLTQQGKFAFIPEPLYETQIHLSQTVNKQRISRSAKFSAQSFVRITGKLRHQGFGGAPLAKHYQTTANYLLRHGRHGFARRFMRAALAMTPFKTKLWAHYVLSFLPSLHGQVRAQQKKLP